MNHLLIYTSPVHQSSINLFIYLSMSHLLIYSFIYLSISDQFLSSITINHIAFGTSTTIKYMAQEGSYIHFGSSTTIFVFEGIVQDDNACTAPMFVILLTMTTMKVDLSQKHQSYLICYFFSEPSENTTRAAWPWFMSLRLSIIPEQPVSRGFFLAHMSQLGCSSGLWFAADKSLHTGSFRSWISEIYM